MQRIRNSKGFLDASFLDPSDLTIEWDGDPSGDEANVIKLLAAMTLQAKADGMSCLAFGIMDGETRLQYSRPASDGKVESWDMTPPPRGTYMPVLRWLINHVIWSDCLPPQGYLDFIGPDGHFEVRVDLLERYEIQLSWHNPRS